MTYIRIQHDTIAYRTLYLIRLYKDISHMSSNTDVYSRVYTCIYACSRMRWKVADSAMDSFKQLMHAILHPFRHSRVTHTDIGASSQKSLTISISCVVHARYTQYLVNQRCNNGIYNRKDAKTAL